MRDQFTEAERAGFVGDIAGAMDEYPKESATCALTRIANATERQAEVHERIGNEISSAIIAIANRIEDSYAGQDGIIGAVCDVRDALRGRKK